MKFTVNVDCTPSEVRAFLGLPNLEPVNDMIAKRLEERTQANLDALTDPEVFFAQLMTTGGANMEKMQAAFTKMMAGNFMAKE